MTAITESLTQLRSEDLLALPLEQLQLLTIPPYTGSSPILPDGDQLHSFVGNQLSHNGNRDTIVSIQHAFSRRLFAPSDEVADIPGKFQEATSQAHAQRLMSVLKDTPEFWLAGYVEPLVGSKLMWYAAVLGGFTVVATKKSGHRVAPVVLGKDEGTFGLPPENLQLTTTPLYARRAKPSTT